MTSKPIVFRGESVRAILDGRKTQTRRVALREQATYKLQRYAEPGDLLWVRETWTVARVWATDERGYVEDWESVDGKLSEVPLGCLLLHRADTYDWEPGLRWRAPISMPRWASRLTLRVVSIREEWLQEITDADVRAEGHDSLGAFIAAWDALNAKQDASWKLNPSVWVIEFEVAEIKK